jgi:hypothetical protein
VNIKFIFSRLQRIRKGLHITEKRPIFSQDVIDKRPSFFTFSKLQKNA